MPPLRRSRCRTAAAAAPPYTAKGWLSRCSRLTSSRRKADDVDDPLAVLPDDILSAIMSTIFTDTVDVTRCAAAFGRWAHVIAARSEAIARSLPPPGRYVPHIALGFFHGGKDDDQTSRRRKLLLVGSDDHQLPRFVPMKSASLLLGSPPFPGLNHGDARVVASRNGRMVLELRNGECHAAGLALCVCNPITGDVATLRLLASKDASTRDYACAILCGDDVLDDRVPGCFRLLVVYNRRGFTALRSYSSDTGSWGPEVRMPGAKIARHVLRRLGPAAVLRGVAYWPMNTTTALGVRIDDAAHKMDVCYVPYSMKDYFPDYRLLGVTPDGMLAYVSAGVCGDALLIMVEALDLRQSDMSTAKGRWERRECMCVCLTQFKISTTTEIKLRWFGDKSGTVIFTIGKGANTSGAFAVNLATSAVEKLADDVECHGWKNLCGYEMVMISGSNEQDAYNAFEIASCLYCSYLIS